MNEKQRLELCKKNRETHGIEVKSPWEHAKEDPVQYPEKKKLNQHKRFAAISRTKHAREWRRKQ